MQVPLIALRILAFCAGSALALRALLSAIRTFVVPRAESDRVTGVVFRLVRRGFNLLTGFAKTYEAQDRIMAFYAPVTLLLLPAVYLAMLEIGFTLMFWAARAGSLYDVFLLSGSSLLTLGFAQVANLFEMILAFAEATLGLILIATLIAYLPTMYTAFSNREKAVSMLEVRAGSPPFAVTLFERYNRLDRLGELQTLWVDWEHWFAEIEESHTSLAALVFFRSPHPERSWVIAAGAVLDAAALHVSTLDVPRDAQADLTIRAGFLALRSIARFFRIPYNSNPQPGDPISITREAYDAACDRLAAAGVPMKADRDRAWRDFAGWRVNYDTVLNAIARMIMAPPAPWVHPPEALE